MKEHFKYYFLILTFISCSTTSSELATDSQRNWCYGAISELNRGLQNTEYYRNLFVTFTSAIKLYENDSGNKINISTVKASIENNSNNALELCKIWAEMNQVD